MPNPREIKIAIFLAAILTALIMATKPFFGTSDAIQRAYCITAEAGCDMDWFQIVLDFTRLTVFLLMVNVSIGLLILYLQCGLRWWYLSEHPRPAIPINPWLRNSIIVYLVIVFIAAGLLAGFTLWVKMDMNHQKMFCRIDPPVAAYDFYSGGERCSLRYGDVFRISGFYFALLLLIAQAPAWLLWSGAFIWRQRKSIGRTDS
jgi:hypothetical protein